MSDIQGIRTGGIIQQTGTATPPLPLLPYLRSSSGGRAAPTQARSEKQEALEKAVAEAVQRHLPEQFRKREDVLGLVRQAVLAAMQPSSGNSTVSSAQAGEAEPGKESDCSACGACSGPGVFGPQPSASASGPGRSVAGTVTAVDATKLTFGRFPGAPDSVVNIVDVITPADGSPMGGGYLEWNALSFPWRLTYAEIDVVLEGELHITSGGRTVVGKPGDMLFIPKDTDVIFSSPGHVRFVYVTWPAEWSATIGQDAGGK